MGAVDMVFEKKNAARAGDMHTCPLAIRASGAGRVVTRADPRRRRAGAALSRGRALAAPLEKRESDAAAKERGDDAEHTVVGISMWKYSAPILRPTKPRMSATAGRRYGRLATARAMSV